MKESVHVIYRNERVDYVEHLDQWHWRTGDKRSASLKWVCDKIDASLKTKFKRPVNAYWNGGYGGGYDLYEATITSMTENGEYWIKVKGDGGDENKRRLVPMKELFAFIPENAAKEAQASKLDADADKLRAQAKAVLKGLTRFSLDAALLETEEAND